MHRLTLHFVITVVCLWSIFSVSRFGINSAFKYSINRKTADRFIRPLVRLKPYLAGERQVAWLRDIEENVNPLMMGKFPYIPQFGSRVPFNVHHDWCAAQFVFSPTLVRNLEEDPDCPLVIIHSYNGSRPSNIALQNGWSTVVDLGNGIGLYRRKDMP